MKICFYVSRNATRLKKFLNYCQKSNNEILSHIKSIVTDNPEDNELKEICNQLSIEYIYLNNSKFDKKNLMSSDYICDLLDSKEIDYLLIYCDAILKGKLIEAYRNKIINFHPSLLPAHAGLMAIDQALNSGTFLLGNSAHFVDEGIDTGPVIMQSIVHNSEFNNYDDVLDLQIYMIAQIIMWLKDSRINLDNGRVIVKDASYQIGTYVPNLEIKSL